MTRRPAPAWRLPFLAAVFVAVLLTGRCSAERFLEWDDAQHSIFMEGAGNG